MQRSAKVKTIDRAETSHPEVVFMKRLQTEHGNKAAALTQVRNTHALMFILRNTTV